MRWEVPSELAGERADLVLARLAGVPRADARAAFDQGLVTVDGQAVAGKLKLAAGAVIEGEIPERRSEVVATVDVEFGVAYEDADVVVVDKPAGLVVHPGAGNETATLAHGLLHRYPELSALGETRRWGIVHRLDRDTSGLLMVARNPVAFDRLQAALKRREVGRTYLALVHGRPPAATGTIDAPIARDPAQPTRMAVDRRGRVARTHYRLLAWWEGPGLSLLEVRLETGRTHQIRVHLSGVGLPLVGDRTYGRGGGPGDPGRVWLHARELVFPHPATGTPVTVAAPVPKDLTRSLRSLGPSTEGEVGPFVEDPGRV